MSGNIFMNGENNDNNMNFFDAQPNNSENLFSQNTQQNQEEHPNTVEYKKMLKEREALQNSILQNLQNMNFTNDEILEVFKIIEKNYALMEEAKQPLINVSANDILNEVEDSVQANIKQISDDMLKELKAKVQEIQSRKR